MRWSEIPRRPPLATLRWFAVYWFLAFGGLAAWQLFLEGSRPLAPVFLGLALSIGPLGIVFSSLVRPVFVGALLLAFPLNWLFSHLLLAIIFYCFFTPLGLLFRLIGRDVLAFRYSPNRDTYWTSKHGAEDVRSYFRQS